MRRLHSLDLYFESAGRSCLWQLMWVINFKPRATILFELVNRGVYCAGVSFSNSGPCYLSTHLSFFSFFTHRIFLCMDRILLFDRRKVDFFVQYAHRRDDGGWLEPLDFLSSHILVRLA